MWKALKKEKKKSTHKKIAEQTNKRYRKYSFFPLNSELFCYIYIKFNHGICSANSREKNSFISPMFTLNPSWNIRLCLRGELPQHGYCTEFWDFSRLMATQQSYGLGWTEQIITSQLSASLISISKLHWTTQALHAPTFVIKCCGMWHYIPSAFFYSVLQLSSSLHQVRQTFPSLLVFQMCKAHSSSSCNLIITTAYPVRLF